MITRSDVYRMMGHVAYTASITKLAHEVKEPTIRNGWQEAVYKMIDKVSKHYKNPHKAVEFLGRALKITPTEFQRAHDAYALQRIAMGDPYVQYDSFDTIKMMVEKWIANAQEIYGDCEPEIMYLHLVSEHKGPFTRINWFKLKMAKKV
ncbi:MAG: hypothetical protein Q4E47_00965 [Candidatus Saccharibacteria bacterium]|nr:hypothetical protein [Candidatus Saccharibacteria bacterium]